MYSAHNTALHRDARMLISSFDSVSVVGVTPNNAMLLRTGNALHVRIHDASLSQHDLNSSFAAAAVVARPSPLIENIE